MTNTTQALADDIQALIEKIENGMATRPEKIMLACLTDCLNKINHTQKLYQIEVETA